MTHEEAMNQACGVLFEGMNNSTLGPALESAIKSYLSASGMFIVPREMTEDMYKVIYDLGYEPCIDDVYNLLLATAPDPFKRKP